MLFKFILAWLIFNQTTLLIFLAAATRAGVISSYVHRVQFLANPEQTVHNFKTN